MCIQLVSNLSGQLQLSIVFFDLDLEGNGKTKTQILSYYTFEHPTTQRFFSIYTFTLTLKIVVINYEAILEVITTPLNKLYNETSECYGINFLIKNG